MTRDGGRAKPTEADVRVGQRWRDKDKRSPFIMRITERDEGAHGFAYGVRLGRKTRVRLSNLVTRFTLESDP